MTKLSCWFWGFSTPGSGRLRQILYIKIHNLGCYWLSLATISYLIGRFHLESFQVCNDDIISLLSIVCWNLFNFMFHIWFSSCQEIANHFIVYFQERRFHFVLNTNFMKISKKSRKCAWSDFEEWSSEQASIWMVVKFVYTFHPLLFKFSHV